MQGFLRGGKKPTQAVIGFTTKRHFKLIISFHKLFMSHFEGEKRQGESFFLIHFEVNGQVSSF